IPPSSNPILGDDHPFPEAAVEDVNIALSGLLPDERECIFGRQAITDFSLDVDYHVLLVESR
ncbi:hypothetical protein, partial [Burkholderia multivorans]